jgi:tRNA1(Val) A37 N6-methylase TrmN6
MRCRIRRAVAEFTEDRFLNGKITLRQPVRGFRSGLDAVMLAAAVSAEAGEDLLELGAGAGAASLCVALRIVDCSVTGIEIDAGLAELANLNAAANGMGARVHFVPADALALPGPLKREFAHVFSNPPFHGDEGEAPPDDSRRRALHDSGRLADWLGAGVKRTVSGGTFTAIVRADRLGEALAALPGSGVAIFPLWPRAGEPAKRVILRTRKGSRAPVALLPGLVLHDADGHYTAQAEDILRRGSSLALDKPRL